MSKLTKEQKLEMLSKAIDAGFVVEMRLYNVELIEDMKQALDIFPELPVHFVGSETHKMAWVKVNEPTLERDDKFYITISLN